MRTHHVNKIGRKMYAVMDGRARHGIDDAIVMVMCESYQEAKSYDGEFGDDTCIVKWDVDRKNTLLNRRVVK